MKPFTSVLKIQNLAVMGPLQYLIVAQLDLDGGFPQYERQLYTIYLPSKCHYMLAMLIIFCFELNALRNNL